MSSLRARVLASVLLLSAAGLVALGLVTYTEQSSFLQERVDREVREAVPAVSRAWTVEGLHVSWRRNRQAQGNRRRMLRMAAGGPAGPGPTCHPAPTASAAKPRAR